MGRFATTAEFYEQYRPPYPAEFFRTAVEKLKLDKGHALIDLGTGPGPLALGFAPYVGHVVGVDPEPAMLAAARAAGMAVALVPNASIPPAAGAAEAATAVVPDLASLDPEAIAASLAPA